MHIKLGRRVVHFTNLPVKFPMPSSLTNNKEIALKTIPSTSNIEIKRVLKRRGGILIAKPDYKKAYVMLKSLLSISPNIHPIHIIDEDRKNMNNVSYPF
uniref:Uncharacterized protein n=1 Tax=Nelumbo nucifera TaxID=4432 RepID=A0A822XRA2_NELNU|nr:TPA_asm: hypothetical protein HUJ06_023102 [Nelumbo nucifera]